MSFFKSGSAHKGSEPVKELIFTIRVHEASEDGETGYWGEVLELDGCTSQGETLDELIENIKESILAWLEAHLAEEGPHEPERGITMTVPVLVPC